MFDPTALSRSAILVVLMLPLAACGNSPQQPSDTVDDRSAKSPYLGGAEDEDNGTGQNGFEDLAGLGNDENEENSTVPPPREIDPISTAAVNEEALLSRFTGEWAADERDCGVGGPSLVSVSPTEIDRVGQQCQVASIIDGGDGSVSVTLSCPAGQEGVATSEIVRLAPADDGNVVINVVGSEEPPRPLTRCP